MKRADSAITTRWVNPGEPLLTAAADWLLGRVGEASAPGISERVHDLSGWLLVMRGRRAGRLLLHQLLTTARERNCSLIPPSIVTQGNMVEILLDAGRPVANPVEQTLAWMHALRNTPSESLAPLMKHLPEQDDWATWHRLARTLKALHQELSGAGVTMEQAGELTASMAPDGESNRWQVLAALRERYQHVLGEGGLIDPHASREAVLQQPREVALTVQGLALIGVVELNHMQRRAIAQAGVPVTAFVHAEESLRDGFDAFGCVRTAFWSERSIAVDDEIIVVADRPTDQAQAVMRAIADLDGACAPEDIIIGVGNDALRAEIKQAAMWADVAIHDAEGRLVRETPAARLLLAAADYLDDPRFAHFASLLRHTDLGAWLERESSTNEHGLTTWLALLDTYFADHLQQRFSGTFLGDPETATRLRNVYERVHEWLAPLSQGDRALAAWIEPIVQVVSAVYADERERDQSGATAIIDALTNHASLPAFLQMSLSAPAAMRLLLREISEINVPMDPRRDAIEQLGWLELHPDPAPVLIIAGVNDGDVPATTKPDPFLPDSVRARLGLACNASRYARDAYLLDIQLRSGKKLRLITGRRSADGEPLTPSRLLLTCDTRELPARIALLCSEPPPPGLPFGMPTPAAVSRFGVPTLPETIAPPESLWVTDFKTFLACPYRFALGRLLGLRAVTDRIAELDAMQFGDLAHDVLRLFGTHETMIDETNVDHLTEFLLDTLHELGRRSFGAAPLPAVQVQLAQLEQRLRSFARFQALSRQEGWRIVHCEHRLTDKAVLDMPHEPAMPIRGKIDRIDQNEHTGAWRIVDYKTGDKGATPIEAHHGGRRNIPSGDDLGWTDLQLPLYRYLALRENLVAGETIELGFVVLPRQSEGAAWRGADWTASHLDAALDCARDVVRRIRAGAYAMNPEFDSPYDPFARICQTNVLMDDEPDAEEVEA